MNTIYVSGIRVVQHKTTERDARRIAIRATEDFLKRNTSKWETNRLLAFACFYEQRVYESAKRLTLASDPLPGEDDWQKDALRLHKYPGQFNGPYIGIEPLQAENPAEGEKTVRPTLYRKRERRKRQWTKTS